MSRHESSELNPELLSWTALLTKWMELAQASLALPPDAEGERWRSAIPSIIALQAVTFALDELEAVAPLDRPLARDRAELLIREHEGRLVSIWIGEPLPRSMHELRADARAALAAARDAGTMELVWPGPGTMVMPAVEIGEPGGSLAVMQPGTLVMAGEPVAWWTDREDLTVAGCDRRAAGRPRQVYRQIDDTGRMVRDVVAPIESPVPPGLPLLVPLWGDGRPIGHFTMDADDWERRQRERLVTAEIPVVHL